MVMSSGLSEFSECRLIETGQDPYIAQLSIADASAAEGDSGSSWMDFEVSLDRTATITITVEYGMSDGSAIDGQDYHVSLGEISFLPGTTQQFISAEILGDISAEPHETFSVNLFAPVGARISEFRRLPVRFWMMMVVEATIYFCQISSISSSYLKRSERGLPHCAAHLIRHSTGSSLGSGLRLKSVLDKRMESIMWGLAFLHLPQPGVEDALQCEAQEIHGHADHQQQEVSTVKAPGMVGHAIYKFAGVRFFSSFSMHPSGFNHRCRF